jgi:hypothetical protein
MSHWETTGQSDEWYTPKYVFDALGCRFDLDVAAPFDQTHVPCDNSIWADSLNREWWGFIWMNPPFGGRNSLEPWLDKFFEHGNGIALTPDRTSAPWWQKAFRRSDALLHVARKIRFIRPDGSEGKSPSNGTTLFAAGEKARLALLEADLAGLGMFAYPWQRKIWRAA